MDGTTTIQDIKEKMDRKPGMFDSMIEKAMKQANIPECDICHKIITSGAIACPDNKGDVISVCMKCIFSAVKYYIKNLEAPTWEKRET